MANVARLLDDLKEHGWTLGLAESATGGLVTSRVVDVPGASDVLLGGIVAYRPETKLRVLGLDEAILERADIVSGAVAHAMARGARRVLDADVAVAVTGNAGPDSDPNSGQPVGTVAVAAITPEQGTTRVHRLSAPDRSAYRRDFADAAFDALAWALLDR